MIVPIEGNHEAHSHDKRLAKVNGHGDVIGYSDVKYQHQAGSAGYAIYDVHTNKEGKETYTPVAAIMAQKGTVPNTKVPTATATTIHSYAAQYDENTKSWKWDYRDPSHHVAPGPYDAADASSKTYFREDHKSRHIEPKAQPSLDGAKRVETETPVDSWEKFINTEVNKGYSLYSDAKTAYDAGGQGTYFTNDNGGILVVPVKDLNHKHAYGWKSYDVDASGKLTPTETIIGDYSAGKVLFFKAAGELADDFAGVLNTGVDGGRPTLDTSGTTFIQLGGNK